MNSFELYKNEVFINESERMDKMIALKNERYISFTRHYNLFVLLKELIFKLNQNKIDYYIDGGLLIGLFRHNNSFVPWDDDIDISIFEKDKKKVLDLKFDKKIIDLTYENVYKFMKEKYKNDNQLFIDIFFIDKIDNNKFHFSDKKHRNYWNKHFIYENEIFPLKEIDFHLYLPDGKIFETLKVKIPNKSTEFLNRVYPKWNKNYILGNCHNSFYKLYPDKKIEIENYYPTSDRYHNTFSTTYNKEYLKLYSKPYYEYDYCNNYYSKFGNCKNNF